MPIYLRLTDPVDRSVLESSLPTRGKQERRLQVIDALRAAQVRSERGPLADLEAAETLGLARDLRSLWLTHALSAKATPAVIEMLAVRADIGGIFHDPPVPLIDDAGPGVPATHGSEPEPSDRRRDTTTSHRSADDGGGIALLNQNHAWGIDWIGAPAAWADGYRGQCVTIAVLDTGSDLLHPDLSDHLWTNVDEIAGNELDDDGNGLVDDINGWDFVAPDALPADDHGHGTHVAGTALGDGTNGTVTGVAPEARLMSVKVLNNLGRGTLAGLVDGMSYAMLEFAQVMNLSLGFTCPPQWIRDDLREAADFTALGDVVVAVAVGNRGCGERPPNAADSPGDVPPPIILQPHLLGDPGGVTSVGATFYKDDRKAGFSAPGPVDWSQSTEYGDWPLCDPTHPNIGLIRPDVCAPGTKVNSTIIGGGYSGDTWDGTSMATPHVAGLAALILSKNPSLDEAEVHELIESTAEDRGVPGKDNRFGQGRISVPAAMTATPLPTEQVAQFLSRTIDDSVGGNGDGALNGGESAQIYVTIQNISSFLLADAVALLRTDSPYVTVTDAIGVYGNIAPGESGTNSADPFSVIVSEDVPEGEVATFEVLVTAAGVCAVLAFEETLHNAQQEGACCFADGTCEIDSGTECANGGGSFYGGGTVCVPNPCPPPPPPTGACCLEDGSCVALEQWQCQFYGGIYQGAGTLCSPNPCPQPVGACCLSGGGGCQIVPGPQCASQCGDFQGNGTLCDPSPCLGGFHVTASDPAPGDDGVAWRPSITVGFSEPVQAADVTPETFRVRGSVSGPAPGTLSVAGDGLSATFTPYYGPNRTFHAEEQIEASLAQWVRSAEGDSIVDPWVWRFRTFAQRGDGSFEGPTVFTPQHYFEDVVAGDLDGDGKTDLVAAGPTLIVYRNVTPDGGDLAYETYSPPVSWVRARTPVLQDFDNDGDLDIAVAEQGADPIPWEIRVGLNAGDGVNYDWRTWATGSYPGPWEVKAGDFDGDGSIDLAYCTSAKLYVHLGDGDGGSRASGIYEIGEVSHLEVADMDEDGRLDIVIVAGYSNRVTLLRNVDPTSTPEQMFAVTSQASVPAGGRPSIADLNEDGRPDVVLSSYPAGLVLCPMGACGMLGAPVVLVNLEECAAQSRQFIGPVPLDFDGDGDVDLANVDVGNGICDRWRLYENDGTGTFTLRTSIANQNRYHPLVADLDDDGVTDIAVPGRGIEVFLGRRMAAGVGEPDAAEDGNRTRLVVLPNPFRSSVDFVVGDAAVDRLEVFDLSGRLVKSFEMLGAPAIPPRVTWDGRDKEGHRLPSGIYLVRAHWGEMQHTRRILRLR